MKFVIRKLRNINKTFHAHRRQRAGIRRLTEALREGFPTVLEVPTRYIISDQVPGLVMRSTDQIEKVRQKIAKQGDMEASVIYSPAPGSTRNNASGISVPKEGDSRKFSLEKLAMNTSLSKQQGIFVMLCALESKAKTILELGSCVGIGSAYLAASEYCLNFCTIEGSSELARIAENSLRETRSGPFEVRNALFDEALDELLPGLPCGIDMVWIDGHHEKLATLHYLNRLKPHLNNGAVVLFDDIYWSDDMLDAWIEIQNERGFSDCVSLGSLGVCLWGNLSETTKIWNFEPFIGTGVWNPAKTVLNTAEIDEVVKV